MNNLFSPFKVGLLLMAALASFMYFSINVRTKLEKEDGNYSVYFYLNDATGLTSKSRVTIAGINVGEINSITLENNKAKVELIIKKGTVLYSDSTAMKKNSSILGDSYIELTTGIRPPYLKDGKQIKFVRETSSMGGMMNKFDSIASDIKEMTQSLKEIITNQATSNSIKNTVEKLENITIKIDKLLESNNNNIDKIMTNIKDFTEMIKSMPYRYDNRINDILKDTSDSVKLIKEIIRSNKAQINELLGSANNILNNTSTEGINKTIENLEKVSATLEKIVNNINEGKGSVGKLLKSDKLHDDVGYIIDETTDLINKVSNVDLIVDAHSEYLFNKGGGNHVFGLRIKPRPNKYYYLGITSSPYLMLVSDKYYYTDADKNKKVVRERIYRNDKVTFSAFMAYKWYFMTFKYGIFDGTAGTGLDLSFLDDSLIINAKINEFSEELSPNLRIGLRYYPFDTWYINTGAVYLLDNRRDFYLGIGATFTDEDIKSVLTLGSISSSVGSVKE